jgi:hypothetical protein
MATGGEDGFPYRFGESSDLFRPVAAAGVISSPQSHTELEAGIACIEAIHAARIRAAFNALGIKIPVVPNALISRSARDNWVIKDRAA